MVFITVSLNDALFRQSLSPGVHAVSMREISTIGDVSHDNSIFDFINKDGKIELSVIPHQNLKRDDLGNFEMNCGVLFGLIIN